MEQRTAAAGDDVDAKPGRMPGSGRRWKLFCHEHTAELAPRAREGDADSGRLPSRLAHCRRTRFALDSHGYSAAPIALASPISPVFAVVHKCCTGWFFLMVVRDAAGRPFRLSFDG
ncbi:hypothetical protein Aduo_013675 [Ancylostoma duodenale]